jgi:hypothetical protein
MFLIATHLVAFLLGAGGVFFFVHRNQAAAVQAATTLANAADAVEKKA